jgi:hypothetical protein
MRKIIVILIASIILSSTGEALINFPKQGKSIAQFSFTYSSASSFYDLNSNNKIYTKDTFNTVVNLTSYTYNLKRTFELTKYIPNLGYTYSLTDDMKLGAELQFSILTLIEKYELDTNRISPTYGKQVFIRDNVSFLPDFYKINWEYRLMKGLYSPVANVSVLLPPSLSNGLQNSDTSKYQHYSAYQFYAGIINSFRFEKSFLELETGYLHRTGDFSKSLLIRFEGGVATVENTSLHGIVLWNQNLESFDNARPVSPMKTTLAESSIDLGVSFNALISKQYLLEFGYFVRLGMTNTLSDGRFHVKAGWLLD